MSEVNKQFEKFATKYGKQNNQEMAMYFKAGWIAAMDKAMETLKNLDDEKKSEVFNYNDVISSKDFPKENNEYILIFAGQAMQSLIRGIAPISDEEEYNYYALATDAFKFSKAMLEIYRTKYEYK